MNEVISDDFEKNLKELERIVQELESGETNLAESLNKFEHGVELYKKCRGTLNSAEKKLKMANRTSVE